MFRIDDRLGASTYVSANVGGAPPAETAQWVDYMTTQGSTARARERARNGHSAPWKA